MRELANSHWTQGSTLAFRIRQLDSLVSRKLVRNEKEKLCKFILFFSFYDWTLCAVFRTSGTLMLDCWALNVFSNRTHMSKGQNEKPDLVSCS